MIGSTVKITAQKSPHFRQNSSILSKCSSLLVLQASCMFELVLMHYYYNYYCSPSRQFSISRAVPSMLSSGSLDSAMRSTS